MRFDIKGADGAIRTKVTIGPELGDDVQIVKRLDDDQVVELKLDAVELRGLEVVVAAIAKVRAEQAGKAPPAAPAAKAGVAALAIAAVVAGGCLQGGDPSAVAFLATYADRTGDGVVDEGDGRGKCEEPSPELLQLEPAQPGCTYLSTGRQGLNLLCGLGQGRWLAFRWDDHGERARGVLHLEAPSCIGDYDVEIHRRAE